MRVGVVNLLFTSEKFLKLKDVLFVPKIGNNLVSGTCLNCEGYKQVYESDRYILSRFGIFVGFGYLCNRLFRLNIINKIPCDNSVFALSSFNSSSKIDDSMLWHARLGHVNFRRIHQMFKDNLIPSLGNKKYVITLIDEYSRFCYVYLLHSKDEALDKFKIYKTEVELQLKQRWNCN